MVRWVYINCIGGVTISSLTLIAATYLLISLWRQGKGKLRVRLLLGMVISDILLGISALIPESFYLSNGVGLITGTAGCDAQAFILTTVLFTQHMWTLAIAIATFLLLRHPLSKWTSMMERYSWAATPIIWGISLVHSGIWMATVGWVSSGNFCYYGSHPIESAGGLDARDLVQFIPRAMVFIIICALYSFLFNFLRRPDTIQLSSQFVSGGMSSEAKGVNMGRVLRKFGGARDPKASAVRRNEPVNPDAPWEQLEFVQVGGRQWGLTPVSSPTPAPMKHFNTVDYEDSVPPSPVDSAGSTQDPKSAATPLSRVSTSSSEAITPLGCTSQRPSESETLVTPEYKYVDGDNSSPESELQKGILLAPPVFTRTQHVHRLNSEQLDEEDDDVEDQEIVPSDDRRASGQTLKEFFQEHQAPGLGAEEEGGRTFGTDTNGKVPISATAYFNRQASLLMLYFPLAYMVVFSVSLVRLIYAMVHKQPSPALTLMSSWMVLSVGLIDGLVYGLAEFIVRRRVRRKMPDRM